MVCEPTAPVGVIKSFLCRSRRSPALRVFAAFWPDAPDLVHLGRRALDACALFKPSGCNVPKYRVFGVSVLGIARLVSGRYLVFGHLSTYYTRFVHKNVPAAPLASEPRLRGSRARPHGNRP